MTDSKQALFDRYFQIDEAIKVNLFPVEPQQVPPTSLALEADMPALFRLANEVSSLDHAARHSLRSLGEHAQELATFLELQSRKIDLIMSHILATEQYDEKSLYCDSYGGSGIKIRSNDSYPLGQALRCKLFLEHEAAAIYCYCEVIDSEVVTGDITRYTLLFSTIRDDDRELLVRASLHAQTRQLKKRRSEQSTEQ